MSLQTLIYICEGAMMILLFVAIFVVTRFWYEKDTYKDTCEWRLRANHGNCVKLSFEQFLTFYNLNPKGYCLFPDHVSRGEPYQEILFSTVRDYKKYKRWRKEIENQNQVKKLLQYVNCDIEKHEQDAKEYFKKVDELVKKM